ncbi:putative acetyltransferase [Crossiella equi]|uniref:Acetyltransferase n=1 Tax=Crossiella equi TaxID=130796 RepID=A0ABS5ACA2_9PSEU|nr:GNAT family N-acetyltransferase [Crossiella equi]MBP2474214.1 putative acetyltransferase [Crossiella equi]
MSSPLTVRPLANPEELAAHIEICRTAFYGEHDQETLDAQLAQWEPAKFRGVFDGEEQIGGGGVYHRRITLPGTGPQTFAGVTMVAVRPGHRRRGALSGTMRALLHDEHRAGGSPLAALWASEGVIYGRYGFGIAARRRFLTVPKGTPFHPAVDTGTARVRELPRAAAEPLLRELYTKVSEQRVGWLDRTDHDWRYRLLDNAKHRDGAGEHRFAVHPEGYALYRVHSSGWDAREVRVHELVAATPVAQAALWRHLLDSDLTSEVKYAYGEADEPLTHLLADPRAVTATSADTLWLRLLDVAEALPLRHYDAPVDLVLAVTDAFCPWNEGRWRLRAGTDGVARVEATDADAELALDVTELASVFLGGISPAVLAGTGRIRELVPGAADRLARAVRTSRAPHCVEIF